MVSLNTILCLIWNYWVYSPHSQFKDEWKNFTSFHLTWIPLYMNSFVQLYNRGKYFHQKSKLFHNSPKMFQNISNILIAYRVKFFWNIYWKVMVFCVFQHLCSYFLLFFLKSNFFQEKLSCNTDQKLKLFLKLVKFQNYSPIIIGE